MNNKARAACAAAALTVVLAACATPQPTAAQRLGELFQLALPLAQLLDKAATADSLWPLPEAAAQALTPQHKACVRSALSGARMARRQMDEALAYAQAHPGEVNRAISLLEQNGAAQALGRATRLLADGKVSSALDALGSMDAAQFKAAASLLLAPEHRELRQAMHLDWLLAPLVSGSSASVPAPLAEMLRECQLPLNAFF